MLCIIKFNDTKERCQLLYNKTIFTAVIGLFMD